MRVKKKVTHHETKHLERGFTGYPPSFLCVSHDRPKPTFPSSRYLLPHPVFHRDLGSGRYLSLPHQIEWHLGKTATPNCSVHQDKFARFPLNARGDSKRDTDPILSRQLYGWAVKVTEQQQPSFVPLRWMGLLLLIHVHTSTVQIKTTLVDTCCGGLGLLSFQCNMSKEGLRGLGDV